MVRRWAWVGIVLFVVADAVLIMVALRHTRDGADSAPPYAPVVASTSSPETSMTPPPTTPATSGSTPLVAAAPSTSVTTSATTASTASTTSTSTATSTPQAAGEAPDLAATVLLDMANDGSAIRATRGACPPRGGDAADRPVVQVSGDAGDTWTTVEASVTAVQRVAASRGGKSWFVATGADCTPVEHDSAGDGKAWSTSSPDGAWSLPVNAAATSILTPRGDVEIGCTPVSLAAINSDSAVVACRDGALRITADSGKIWTDGASVPGVVGISFVGSKSGFALAASPGCPAQVWRTTDGAASFAKLACLDGTAPQAITAAGSTILAQMDGAMQRSEDEGDTWSPIP